MSPTAVILTGAVGACVGSFSANLGMRSAKNTGWAFGRSQCEHCERSLPFHETAPLVSYVGVGGRCVGCCKPISPLHFLGEAAGALLLPMTLYVAGPGEGTLLFLLAMTLVASATCDVRAQRLPDGLTAVAAVLCVALAASQGLADLRNGIVAAIVSVALGLSVQRAFRSVGKPALGLGDVKLIGALAPWLGAWTPLAVAIASAAGLTVLILRQPLRGRIAFGPWIAAAAFGVGLWRVVQA